MTPSGGGRWGNGRRSPALPSLLPAAPPPRRARGGGAARGRRAPPAPPPRRSVLRRAPGWTLAAVIVSLGVIPLLEVWNKPALYEWIPEEVRGMHEAIARWHLSSGYGLFRVMTTQRAEIVVQGSADGKEWKDYEFAWKPGDVGRRPRFVEPHQPRLDWQMWFAALGSFQGNRWFQNFLVRLLEGSPPVLDLLERNPFPDAPPRYIRAQLYHYHFSDASTLRSSGAWWTRELIGPYAPAISLRRIGARE